MRRFLALLDPGVADNGEPFRQHHTAWAWHPDLFSMGIPLILAAIPVMVWLLYKVGLKTNYKLTRHEALPVLAGISWLFAVQLPNIPVWADQTESFTMHLLGGLVIAPCLYYYALHHWNIEQSPTWWKRFGGLFGFVFAFGMINEIGELIVVKLGILKIDLTDSPYDMAAALIGAIICFGLVQLWRAALWVILIIATTGDDSDYLGNNPR